MKLRSRRCSQGRWLCTVWVAPRHAARALGKRAGGDVVEAAARIIRLEAYVGALGKRAGGVRVRLVGVVGVCPLLGQVVVRPRRLWRRHGSCIGRLAYAARASLRLLG